MQLHQRGLVIFRFRVGAQRTLDTVGPMGLASDEPRGNTV